MGQRPAEQMAENKRVSASITTALIIRAPWARLVVSGQKSWELRTGHCHKRELIGIIQARTKSIIGVVRIIGSVGPLSEAELQQAQDKHLVPPEGLTAFPRHHFAWVMTDAHAFQKPILYLPAPGQQTFVTLRDSKTASRVSEQLSREIAERDQAHVLANSK